MHKRIQKTAPDLACKILAERILFLAAPEHPTAPCLYSIRGHLYIQERAHSVRSGNEALPERLGAMKAH